MKKGAKKKRPKAHPCIDQINAALAPRGERLLDAISLNGAPCRIFVATEKITGSKGLPALLASNYCPFCGEALP